MGTKKQKPTPEQAQESAANGPLKVGTVWTDPKTGKRYNVVDGDCTMCAFGAAAGACPSPEASGLNFCDAEATNTKVGAVLVAIDADAPATEAPTKAKGKAKGKKPAAVAAAVGLTKRQLDIPYDSLLDAPWNKREAITEESVADLVASIRAVGLIDRVTVKATADGVYHQILAGHRRVLACHLAGVEPIPCEVVECDNPVAHMITAIENMHREDLTAMQECAVVEDLLAVGFTAEQVAEQTGRHLRWVYRRASVRNLTQAWRRLAIEHGLCAAFLEAVARYPAETQDRLFQEMDEWDRKQIVEHGGSVEQVRNCFANFSHALGQAPWAAKHPDWCADCERSSSGCGELFDQEELEDGSTCLDPKCWEEMIKAWVREETARLEAKHGEVKTIAGSERYSLDTRNKKDAGHTKPVMVTDGPTAGTVLWMDAKQGATGDSAAPGDADEPKATQPTPEQKRMARVVKCVETMLNDSMAARPCPFEGMNEYLVLRLASQFGTINNEAMADGTDWEEVNQGTDQDVKFHLWTKVAPVLRRRLFFDAIMRCESAYDEAVQIAEMIFEVKVGELNEKAEQAGKGKGK